MRTYVLLTGLLFGAIAVLHIERIIYEWPAPIHQPGFLLLTLLAAALCAWAGSLLRRRRRSH
jgi:ABC-type uncharacterized transport system permease subunit